MAKIRNFCVYQTKDGKYCVSFNTHNGVENFSGERDEVLKHLVMRVKRILHVHTK